MKSNYIGTEHLLSALLHESDGIVGGALVRFRLQSDVMRATLLSVSSGTA